MQQAEVAMGDTGMEIKRSRVTQKCYLVRCTWAWEMRMGKTRSGCMIQGLIPAGSAIRPDHSQLGFRL